MTKTFTYGSLAYGSVSNGYILELTLTETAVDTAANASTLAYTLKLRSGGNNRFTGYGIGAELTLDDQVVASRDRYTEDRVSLDYNSTFTLLSGSVTVSHEENGEKTVSVGFSLDMATGSYVPGPIEVTGERMALTYIARASTLGASDAAIGSRCSICINRKSTAFTHTLRLEFGALSGYISAGWELVDTPQMLTDTAISFLLPDSFYNQIPDTPSGTAVLKLTTYDADREVGQSSTTFTVRADPALCAPEITASAEDVNPDTLALTGNKNVVVRFASTLRCQLTARGKNGAAIVQTAIAGQDCQQLEIPGAESGELLFQATDSRGFSTVRRISLPLVEYVALTVNPVCSRTDPTGGNALLQVTGNWFSGAFGEKENHLTLSCCVDGTQVLSLQPQPEGDTYSAQCTLTGLDYQQSHSITVTACDGLQKVEKDVVLGRGIPVFDWGAEDFCFHVPVSMPQLQLPGGAVCDYVTQQGSTDIWHWQKWASGNVWCWGSVHMPQEEFSQSMGGAYLGGIVPARQLPVRFAAAPVERVSLRGSLPLLCWSTESNDAACTASYRLASLQQGVCDVTVDFFVQGMGEEE